MMLIKYWKQLLVAVVLLLAAVAWRIDRTAQYRAGHAAATAEISAELAKTAAKQQAVAHDVSAAYQTAKAAAENKEQIRYVQVQKIVDRPVYHNVCLDADGLHIINSAIADGN